MNWISINDQIPNDDQSVFVINSKVQMLPIKAFYCEEWKEFISLETDSTNHPISVTHWMEMPKRPERSSNFS